MKERLIEFLAYLGIGQDKFEKRVVLSRGFVNKVGDSIRKKNLDKISSVYPDLNISWLKTGIGTMLIGEVKEGDGINEKIDELNEQIKLLRQLCEARQTIIDQYEIQLGKKDKAI